MPDSPRVSIITSVYNSSEFLFDFFLDLKKQSIFSECEVLILDANKNKASEDLNIINKFLDLPNIKYFYIGQCSVYEAWNKGIQIAKAPIITNRNTDDRRKWNSLEYQVKFLEDNNDIDLCYGSLKVSNTKNEDFENCKTNRLWTTLEGTIENQLKHNSPHCLPVWRKSVHDKFGLFDEYYFSAADYDMWFRILKGGGKIQKLYELVCVYYENPNSISRNRSTYEKAIKEVQLVKSFYK